MRPICRTYLCFATTSTSVCGAVELLLFRFNVQPGSMGWTKVPGPVGSQGRQKSMTVQFAEGRAVVAIDTLSLEDETHAGTVFLFGCVDALYMR